MVLSCMKFVQGVIYNFHRGISSNTPNNHMGQSLDPNSTHSLLVMPPYMPRSIPCLLDLIRQVDCLLLVAGRRSLHSLGRSDRRQIDLKQVHAKYRYKIAYNFFKVLQLEFPLIRPLNIR